MNSTEYAFHTDVAEKKRIARGAYSKKTHNGKGGCRLPHEDLTEAQRRALNGPVATYNLDKPMLWKEFNTLPGSAKKLYLTELYTKYGAKDNWVADMLGVGRQTVVRMRNSLGVAGASRGGTISAEKLRTWAAFLGAQTAETPEITETEEAESSDAAEAEALPTTIPSATWEDLIAATKILGARYGVRIRIEVDT